MKKRIVVSILIIALIISLTACGRTRTASIAPIVSAVNAPVPNEVKAEAAAEAPELTPEPAEAQAKQPSSANSGAAEEAAAIDVTDAPTAGPTKAPQKLITFEAAELEFTVVSGSDTEAAVFTASVPLPNGWKIRNARANGDFPFLGKGFFADVKYIYDR